MGVLGVIAAILFLAFIQWSRNNKDTQDSTINKDEKMETNVLKNLIENLNFNFDLVEENEDLSVFKMIFQTEKGSLDVITTMKKQMPYHVSIYTYFPVIIPKEKKIKVAEFLTYLNDGLYIGNFELNMANGTLRTKLSYCFDDTSSRQEYFYNYYLHHSYELLEYYFDGIMTVIYSEKSAQKTYDELINQIDVSLN